jgi:hypothetical protein
MDFNNCRLFQKQSGTCYCELSGESTCCTGDILYCERSEALRDYVLTKLAKRTADSKPENKVHPSSS